MADALRRSASDLVGATPNPRVRPVSLAIRRYLLDYSPDGIALAVSGGADSLALAVSALDLAARLNIPAVTLTVDHGVREGSDEEAHRVAALMEELGAQQSLVLTGSILQGSGPEGGARELRYSLLRQAAVAVADQQRLHQMDLLFGHTMDDQAETVLLRLARGAGTASLGGIRRRRELSGGPPALYWGRPLLGIRRQQTLACCDALGLEPVEDPTNSVAGPWRTSEGDPLRRAAVREWALPELSKALGQDVIPALARVAEQAQQDERALSEWAGALFREARSGSAEDSVRLEPFITAPIAVRKRALRLLALQAGVPGGALTAVHLERLDALIADWHGQGSVDLPGGVSIGRQAGTLRWRLNA